MCLLTRMLTSEHCSIWKPQTILNTLIPWQVRIPYLLFFYLQIWKNTDSKPAQWSMALSYLWLSVNLQKQVLKVNIHKPAQVSKFPWQNTDHTHNTATAFCCKLAFLAIIYTCLKTFFILSSLKLNTSKQWNARISWFRNLPYS